MSPDGLPSGSGTKKGDEMNSGYEPPLTIEKAPGPPKPCENCGGKGLIGTVECDICHGTGVNWRTLEEDVYKSPDAQGYIAPGKQHRAPKHPGAE